MSTGGDNRPRPEQFLTLIREQQRGRLKVYLGFAPGVGKTYEMLQEGQRLKRQGVDVVIGIVETHGRAETAAQIGDLEQVPRRRIEYHGVVLEEMDLDAVLARRPTVALVDELAHTNAPGSRNAKRYQDVEELLRAGINVITTLNIQHLESLYDMIERFTGVKVKERVPDFVIAQADQIVNVDLSAEGLAGTAADRQGLSARSRRAGAGQLLHRSEPVAVARAGPGGDRPALDRRRHQRGGGIPGTGSERVMVCLSSGSPNTHQLLRKAARVADRMNAPWYAVYVQTPAERVEKITAATQRRISDCADLAQQLGGISMPFSGRSFSEAVAEFVASTASRTSWWDGPGGRGIGAGSASRRWTGCCAVPEVDVLVVGASG